jgi:hypothetical protein
MNICSLYQFSESVLKCLHSVRQQSIILLDNKELYERNGGKRSHYRARLDTAHPSPSTRNQISLCSKEGKQESTLVLHWPSVQTWRNDKRKDYREDHQEASRNSLIISSVAGSTPTVSQAISVDPCSRYLVVILQRIATACNSTHELQRLAQMAAGG